ncbi:MAG TPA: HAD family hydrolase [Rhodopirellula sp.]|nr:HAD family hydrolase [Rhodopirellula sp.]
MNHPKSHSSDGSAPNPQHTTSSQSQCFPTSAPSPKICGVALDMDGLLFDTEGLYWQVGDTVLQRRGLRYSKALQSRMMGRVGAAALQQMVDFHSLEDSPESLLAESDELFADMLAEGVPPIPGVPEWIDHLKTLQIPFGLATSSRRKFVDILFEPINWKQDLTFILTGDDVKHGKPHPEMYLRAAMELNVSPEQMLVLEDSSNGCAAAIAAGACTVAIPSIHTQDQSFQGAHLIADNISDPRLWAMIATEQ